MSSLIIMCIYEQQKTFQKIKTANHKSVESTGVAFDNESQCKELKV